MAKRLQAAGALLEEAQELMANAMKIIYYGIETSTIKYKGGCAWPPPKDGPTCKT
jgi:hypothetical protein